MNYIEAEAEDIAVKKKAQEQAEKQAVKQADHEVGTEVTAEDGVTTEPTDSSCYNRSKKMLEEDVIIYAATKECELRPPSEKVADTETADAINK